jgi:hypothetical protein
MAVKDLPERFEARPERPAGVGALVAQKMKQPSFH